jgi:hypothetical protein
VKVNILKRLVVVAVISFVSLVGISISTNAQQNTKQEQQDQKQNNKKQKKQQQAQQQQAQQQKWQRDRDWQQRIQQQQQQNEIQQQDRLSQQRQQQLVLEHQQRLTQYSQVLDQQQRAGQQYAAQLQQQKRMAQYGYQQEYIDRLRQQRMNLQNERYDYDRDPYFSTAWNYRYTRGGRYYETNQYGANMLREAVNYGYQEGFRAGQADRQDRWRFNYKTCYAYQDANFGYNGFYIAQVDYNYYFREGFRRGYEDGYYSRYRYGSYSNGKYTILGAIVGSIIDMQSRR